MPIPDLHTAIYRLVASRAEVRLFNVYQGIPISYPATVLAGSGTSLRVKTEKYQVVCLYRERETYLQSSQLPSCLKARVTAIDLHKLEAVLTTFQPVHGRIGDRRLVRVYPKEYILGEVKTKDLIQTFQGELVDLSQDGLAVHLPQKYFYPRVYPPGGAITISLRLPGEFEAVELEARDLPAPAADPISRYDRSVLRYAHLKKPPVPETLSGTGREMNYPLLEIHGHITQIREEPRLKRVRIGIQIRPGDPSQPVIARFISRRQSEILREIKDVAELLS